MILKVPSDIQESSYFQGSTPHNDMTHFLEGSNHQINFQEDIVHSSERYTL